MVTIKSYTDLEQSRKLAKILPLESADMCWTRNIDNGDITALHVAVNYGIVTIDYPCWSLASLLGQLKSEIQLENKQILFLHINKYNDINYDIRYTNSWTGEVLIAEADNLVDACVIIVEKLKELNLLQL